MTEPIRVVVADDQAMVRHSLALLIDAEPGIEVVGQAADGDEALALVSAERPDVVCMDIRMPGCDGLEATRRIAADPALAGVRVCVLTMFELDEYVFAALRAGASGFLLKDAEPDRLIAAIRSIHAGEPFLAPSVMSRVIEHALRTRSAQVPAGRQSGAPGRRPEPDLSHITPREREVLTLIGKGLNNAEIQAALFISRGTLKTHVGHLLAKLGARDRSQLIIAAHEARLVER